MKNQMSEQITIFDEDLDTKLYKHKITLEKIKNELMGFGLTKNQARVFIYLGKYGSKSASQIAKALQLPRTETYHLVNSLQNIGLVVAELSNPTKYTAIEMKKAITGLIQQEQEKINNLSGKEESLSEMWKDVPFFVVETDESKQEETQLLQNVGSIMTKIKKMAGECMEEFKIYGTIQNTSEFYHSDIFDVIENSPAELRTIITPSSKIPEFLSENNSENIRIIPKNTESKCFVVSDSKEVLIFLRNVRYPKRKLIAYWSNSESLIDMMTSLFNLSWENAEAVY